MTRRDWQQVVQTLPEHTLFNLAHASSLRTSQAAKILPSKRFLSDSNSYPFIRLVLSNFILFSILFFCRKCHSSRMIWNWSAKGKINTSVVPMFSGNGEVGQLISLNILFYPPMYLSFH